MVAKVLCHFFNISIGMPFVHKMYGRIGLWFIEVVHFNSRAVAIGPASPATARPLLDQKKKKKKLKSLVGGQYLEPRQHQIVTCTCTFRQ